VYLGILLTISVKLERPKTPLGSLPIMDEDSDNVTTVPNLLHFQAMEPDVYNTPYTTPIIIDNGCTTYRFGFSDASTPYSIANIYSRYRERKHNLQIALFGDNVEVESGAKTQSKTAWEGDILINFDAMENALDYSFCKLGLDTNSVMHPVLVSERLCTPVYSRSGMFAFYLLLWLYLNLCCSAQ
jgi:actin-related protein 5